MNSRPQPVSVAAVLLALLSLPNVLYPLLALEGEVPRTPSMRSSQNSYSRHFGEDKGS
jgi:hypothetical protein